MTKHVQMMAFAIAAALALPAIGHAQDKPAAPATAKPEPAMTPLKVQVVIARFEGEKKLSSLPYTLSVNAGSRATLRMGAKVPVMMVTTTNLPKDAPQVGPVQYQDVGTDIDCSVSRVQDDGRYRLEITVSDTSVYGDTPANAGYKPTPGNVSFRSFRASDSMVLRDGQTSQFTTATDKVSGEIVKVDVTLSVVK